MNGSRDRDAVALWVITYGKCTEGNFGDDHAVVISHSLTVFRCCASHLIYNLTTQCDTFHLLAQYMNPSYTVRAKEGMYS